jgi:hypothetical protein
VPVVWSIAYLGIVLLLGHVLVSAVWRGERRPLVERVGLSATLGAGGLGVLFFWLSLAGLIPTRVVTLSIGLVLLVAQGVLWRIGRLSLPMPLRPAGASTTTGNRAMTLAAWTVVALLLLVASVHAVGFPQYEWDGFAIWGMKAKVLSTESLRAGPAYFHDVSLSYSHLDYPLLVPFLTAGAYGMMGQFHEQLGKVCFPLLFLALGLVLNTGLRWKLDSLRAAMLTALAVSVPVLVRWAGAGTADVALALYYTGMLCYSIRWLDEGNLRDLLTVMLCTVFCVFTKSEGLALALILVLGLFLFSVLAPGRRRFTGLALLAAGVLTLSLPWLIWSSGLPRTHENYAANLNPANIIANWDRLRVILPEFARQVFAWERWGILWVLLALSTICGWRRFRERHVGILWFLLVAHLGLYVLIFIVTPWDVRELLASALDRLILHTVPAAVLLIGFHWALPQHLTAGMMPAKARAASRARRRTSARRS